MATYKSRHRTDYIAIHCSATSEAQDISAADIDRWHRAKGWNGIGYHFVIRRDGTVENGRPQAAIGAHVGGFNDIALGICMVGGIDADDMKKAEDNYTVAQYNSLAHLLKKLTKDYPNATVQGHRDFPGVKKACPCFDAAAWWKTQE